MTQAQGFASHPIEPDVEIMQDTYLGDLVCQTYDGRTIYERPEEDIETDAIIQAQAKSLKYTTVDGKQRAKPDVDLLTKMMAIALFTVDGEPITIDMLTAKPSVNPKAIGWKAFTVVQQRANEFSEGLPSGKTSSGPVES